MSADPKRKAWRFVGWATLSCALAVSLVAQAEATDGKMTSTRVVIDSGSPAVEVATRVSRSRGRMAPDLTRVCGASSDCNDRLPCTEDVCLEGTCLNLPIPGCVPCEISYSHCPMVEIVFVMDTSGSMRDEAAALCAGIADVVAELGGMGFEVIPAFFGITQLPGGPFDCLFDTVVGYWGYDVPGPSPTCPLETGSSPYESWGPATAIVAEHYPWRPGTTRMIVPISDEGPCNGSRPEGCNDPGDDRDSIENAIAVASARHVIVSPIAGTSSDACVINLGTAIAAATGGQLYQTKDPMVDFKDSITSIIQHTCDADDHCDDAIVCTADDRCHDGICFGTPIAGCRTCQDDLDCDDHSRCTLDSCVAGLCRWTPQYDPQTECCDPAIGTLRIIDDGNACTADACDPLSGRVNHASRPAGFSCDDGQTCTVNDACDGAGACAGAPVYAIACRSDQDCFGHSCQTSTGFCVCNATPQLCLKPEPSALPTENCYAVGDDVYINIELGNSAALVAGGQFLVSYDLAGLQFLDVVPGDRVDPGSPFGTELSRTVDEAAGTVFYAVGAVIGGPLTHGPAIMASLHFKARSACRANSVCFADDNPTHTRLSDAVGHLVPFVPCCTGELYINGAKPTVNCPNSVTVNAEAETLSANVAWSPLSAAASCGGAASMTCTATNSYGANVDTLIEAGGRAPLGRSSFECVATDACGAANSCNWDVVVRELNTVEVDVQLSPTVSAGPLRRCIQFAFYSSCHEAPVVIDKTIEFGLPFNLPGRADRVQMTVPPGQYACATARDAKHTLRSAAMMHVTNGKYVVQFKGDPALGGNWLVGGNLDGNNIIDAVDQALLMNQYLQTLDPNTACGSPGFHGDINGNGVVNLDDLAFIQRNLLAVDAPHCCSETNTAGESSGYEEITVEELSSMGYGDLSAADIDGDGVISRDDMTLLMRLESAKTVPPRPHTGRATADP